MFDKIPVNKIQIPYEDLKISITGIQHYNNSPTTLYVKIETLNPNFVVYAGKLNYCDMRLTDAILTDISKCFGILKHISQPSKNIVIVLHDLASFLVLSKQSHIYSNSLKWQYRKFRSIIRTNEYKVKVVLGDPKVKTSFQEFEISNSTNTAPSLETLGGPLRNFVKVQIGKRRILCLIKR